MQNLIKNKYIRLLPALLWMWLIFYFSSGPTTAVVGTSLQRFIILKSFHVIEYSTLYLLLTLGKISPRTSIVISYIYALADEFHQSFVPGRSALLRDTFIDLFGIMLAYIITLLTVKKYSTRINKIINLFSNEKNNS